MKKALAAAVAVLFWAVPSIAAKAPKINGFATVLYTMTDEAGDVPPGPPNEAEGKFSVEGEIDIEASLSKEADVRVDLDLDPDKDILFEQVCINIKDIIEDSPVGSIGLKAGIFNSPIGWEKEDKTDRYQITHGLIYELLEGQNQATPVGNNVVGLALNGEGANAGVTLAYLNDIGNVAEKNSIALAVNASPSKDIDIELGYITQDGSVENILDLNATIKFVENLILGVELLMTNEVVNQAYGVYANYKVNDNWSVSGRLDNVSYINAALDEDSLTLTAAYKLAEKIILKGEFKSQENADFVGFELIAEF